MELTTGQKLGLTTILDRYHNGKKYVTISGFAGVGKTTLVKHAIAALGIENVAYATFTGHAAEVLRSKGNEGAITLHKLLYDHYPKPTGGYGRHPKEELTCKVVVVDEVSMVPKTMIDLLLSHNVFVIFLGDPYQLPALSKDDSNDILDNPHVFLTEIMRQEAESEIIKITMAIRNGQQIPYYKGKESMVIPKNTLTTDHLLWADQVICATNNTRRELNAQMRECHGIILTNKPIIKEKLICVQNRWDDISDTGSALVNGTTGFITKIEDSCIKIPMAARTKVRTIPTYKITFTSTDGSTWKDLEIDKQFILTGNKFLSDYDEYRLRMVKGRIGDYAPKYFDFGYAITCHKAQGSTFGNVLVLEEGFPYSKEEHSRWLYTACTRPSGKLVLVKEGK